MGTAPQTRASLLLRLKDRADEEAWREFVEIYRPVVVRLARKKGLQDADADDLAQQVFLAVAGAIDRWQMDPARARFRTWLGRIAHNLLVNMVTRRRADCGSGDTQVLELLHERPAAEGPDSDWVRRECQAELFRWAARHVRKEFEPATWQAFWETAVRGRDSAEVAAELGKSIGSVYAARSRVMRRLRNALADWEDGPASQA
jgi:RNA polymerase sigma-70 factor (ECF subfamily)